MRRQLLFAFLMIAGLMPATAQNKSGLSGFVKEASSLENLPGAIIKVAEADVYVTANEYGFYSLSIGDGNYTIEIYAPGYENLVTSVTIGGESKQDFLLEAINTIDDVVITARSGNAQDVKMGTHVLDVENIKAVPTLLGEKDVFKVIKLLPGVQKGQEGSSGYNVRGGGTDQNLIILDDAVVYNASHLFGFFSTFNGDALKGVELIKGGYPAKYGERLSSVLNLTMKEGNKKYYTGEYGIGLLSARGTLEGPIVKDKASFLVSGRRTYGDVLIQPFIIAQGAMAGYYFYDLNAKVNYQINDKNSLYLSGYFGRDLFYMNDGAFSSSMDGRNKARFGWGNATGTLRWNHIFSSKLFANLTLNYSNYNMAIRMEEKYMNESYLLRLISSIDDIGLKYDISYYQNPDNTIRVGYKATRHLFRPNAMMVKQNNVADTSLPDANKYISLEHNLYIDDEWKVNKNLAMNIGVRGSSFTSRNKTYFNAEPRASLRYLVNDLTSVKASYTVMNQYMHLLSSTGINLPTDLWVPATDRVAPQRAYQYSLGLFKDMNRPEVSISLEGYYKTMNNIISYKEGASFLELEDPFDPDPGTIPTTFEDKIISGRGRSYGAELMIQKKKGKFNGWLSYTWSKTQYQFTGVNNGEWFYPRFDRRHDLNIVGFYEITPRIKVNALFTLATGNPLSLPQYNIQPHANIPSNGDISNSWNDHGTLYSNRNDLRTEVYHRMDVGIQFIKQRKRGIRTWEISFYNIYNRMNPFFYMEGEDRITKQDNMYKYTIFPFIPSITYSFKFK